MGFCASHGLLPVAWPTLVARCAGRKQNVCTHNMTTPELRQFGTLEAEDFDRHPVWIGCDYGKPWYGQSDEETFRPWIGKLPVDPAEGIFLVRAVIQLRD